jgi:hypothetical protein
MIARAAPSSSSKATRNRGRNDHRRRRARPDQGHRLRVRPLVWRAHDRWRSLLCARLLVPWVRCRLGAVDAGGDRRSWRRPSVLAGAREARVPRRPVAVERRRGTVSASDGAAAAPPRRHRDYGRVDQAVLDRARREESLEHGAPPFTTTGQCRAYRWHAVSSEAGEGRCVTHRPRPCSFYGGPIRSPFVEATATRASSPATRSWSRRSFALSTNLTSFRSAQLHRPTDAWN